MLKELWAIWEYLLADWVLFMLGREAMGWFVFTDSAQLCTQQEHTHTERKAAACNADNKNMHIISVAKKGKEKFAFRNEYLFECSF